MIVIRLAPGGKKKRPFYRIVVADQRYKLQGRFIEQIGFFNPIARGKEERLRLARKRLAYWTSQGAQMSTRVATLAAQWDRALQASA